MRGHHVGSSAVLAEYAIPLQTRMLGFLAVSDLHQGCRSQQRPILQSEAIKRHAPR